VCAFLCVANTILAETHHAIDGRPGNVGGHPVEAITGENITGETKRTVIPKNRMAAGWRRGHLLACKTEYSRMRDRKVYYKTTTNGGKR